MNRDQSNRRDKRKRFSAFLVFLMCCVMLFTSCGEEEKQTEEKNELSQFHHVPVKISGQERLPYHSDLGVSWKNTSVLNISYHEQNLPNHGSASKGLNSVPSLDYVYEKGKLIQEIFSYSSGEQSKTDDTYDELRFLS